VLENTGQAETKVPNTLAIVAAQAAVEQAKKYQEQVREALERQRANERAQAVEDSKKAPSEDAVQVTIDGASAPVAQAEPAAPQASRGAAVDLNA
jgi:hypothetical protein